MKVTGYRLREALRRWQLRRDTAAGQFPKALTAFPGEDKPEPRGIADKVLQAEIMIATLQGAQTRYNLAVRVSIGGTEHTLLDCVKRIGGFGRIEKMWRGAAALKEDRYSYGDLTRQAGTVVAERTITVDDAATKAQSVAALLGEYREAIAVGNAREIELEDLDPALFG